MQVLLIHPNTELFQRFLLLVRRYHATGFHASDLSTACALLDTIHPQLVIAARTLLAGDTTALFHALGEPEPPPLFFLTNIQSPADLSGPEESRIEAMLAYLSSKSAGSDNPIQVGNLRIDMAHKQASLGEQWVALPPLQFRLLSYLAEHTGSVIGYRELLRAVWGYDGNDKEARSLLKVHVRQLRRRLGLAADSGEYLRAVRGFGYILEPPPQA
jgi:DNA-binding response OmpR family regulator